MDSWVLIPCQRSRLDLLKRLLDSLEHPVDRVVIVATYPDPLYLQDIEDYAHYIEHISPRATEHHIGRWWNVGLDCIASMAQKNHEVLVVSSDNIGTNYSVAKLGAFLREHKLAMVGPNYWGDDKQFFYPSYHRGAQTRVPGCCWMVAGELGLRCDEQFRWWYSDDDIEMQARNLGGTGIVPGIGLLAGPDTALSVEKEQWAEEDRQKFVAKWNIQPW